MDDDDIKQDVQSPLHADDHAAEESLSTDDLDDDLGRSLHESPAPISTHPKMDTDVDSTELYQQGLDETTDVDENFNDEEEDEDEEDQDSL